MRGESHMINKIIGVYFSPNGTSKKVCDTVVNTLAERLKDARGSEIATESVSFTLPKERERTVSVKEDELLVAVTPTYAGKIPNKILPAFKDNIKGNGGKAVAVATYGNRAYENSVAELCRTLKDNGFRICAAAAVVSTHCMIPIGHLDLDEVKDFAEKIDLTKEDVAVKGDADAPYYSPMQLDNTPAKFLKATPKTDESKCIKCGLCAKSCPMGSINPNNVSEITGICIKCHACINKCPKHAKYFDDPQLLSHQEMVKQNFAAPNMSEFFL